MGKDADKITRMSGKSGVTEIIDSKGAKICV